MIRIFSALLALAAANSLPAAAIFWTTWNQGVSAGIYRADADGGNVTQVITEEDLMPTDYSYYVGLPMDLAVDGANERVYLVETELDTIWVTDYSGSTFSEVLVVDGEDPHQIEVDLENQLIYWIEDNGPSSPARIGRCGLDGSNPAYLINDAGSRGGGIALDAVNGHIFWTESYSGPTVTLSVWRCDLDGSNPLAIVSGFDEGTFELGSVAADPETQKVYWIQDQNLIRRANYDGSEEETLYEESSLGDRSHLVIDTNAGQLYWSGGFGSKTIGRAALNGSGSVPLIENLTSNPFGIALVSGGDVRPVINLGAVTATTLTVSWTQPSIDWQAEHSSLLTPDSWSPLPAGAVIMDGLNGTAVLDATTPRMFLRLKKSGL